MPGFELACRDTMKGKRPFLPTGSKGSGSLELASVSLLEGRARVLNNITYYCYNSTSKAMTNQQWWAVFLPHPYLLSETSNKFMVTGCQAVAYIRLGDTDVRYLSGCSALCGPNGDNLTSLSDGTCSGEGCCQATITKGHSTYDVQFDPEFNTTEIYNTSLCNYAALMESSSFNFRTTYATSSEFFDTNGGQVPTVVEWAIRDARNCEEAKKNRESYACVSVNSICVNSSSGPGYICNCTNGFQGNPYLPNGCQGAVACVLAGLFCFFGWEVIKHKQRIREQALLRQTDEFFQQHGGQLLLEMMKIEGNIGFTLYQRGQIETATNNFNKSHIIGEGGQGTVYRAVIDDTIVAIKRCKEIDETRKMDFMQELVILCRVSHPNIVKLLGCCLQFEAPMLVYEFVQNKTLQELLDLQRSRRFHVTVGTRLRIAAESADALAHLHSLSHPILHGDVKPANILLAEGLVAKVSDFGCSTIDEKAQVVLKGTPGYIDPEYLLEYQLTTKNDIYSFGVILLELLTGRRPLSKESKTLTSMFQEAMADGTLAELVDNDIADEVNMRVIHQAAVLASQCLVVPGTTRPAMALVAAELRQLALADEVQQCPQPPLILEDLGLMEMGGKMSTWYGESRTSGIYSIEKKAVLSIEFAR
ncbi:hypothetical protein E2562_017616 [Oryza meyeriana var. granulata]|uniref:Protein kinase domain-containing protein n=1 Tax=Oryza meyeriana var. granulata TaxID=110450 RepID=A0A6G1BXK7_9ORYZ|nr:hypothetical protein E2562_017616 [Oryza meyeriana var. granulata]